MLTLTFPDDCRAERAWIADVVLREFLGVPFMLAYSDTRAVTLTAEGRRLEMPDLFFRFPARKWLDSILAPPSVLPLWDPAASGLLADAPVPPVPLLFGSGGFSSGKDGSAVLELDVLGSAFFMLSRYEEAASSERDTHDRFPAAASVAYRCGFIDRPLVDEYVEILWLAMRRIWPGLQRRQRQFRMRVSCDVDHPYDSRAGSLHRTARKMAGELVRTRRLSRAAAALRNYRAIRNGNWDSDPYYYTVDWMMDVNERAGNNVSFYFIPEITDALHDDTCLLSDRAVQAMMARIAGRGHEIGMHPGYNTFESGQRIASARLSLQSVLDQSRLRQQVRGGRHHYLRWSTRTPANWDAAGLEYDSTLGYAQHAGFRCGTCHEYPMYDLHRRAPLRVRQRPLICMEASVIRYMGCGLGEAAYAQMARLKAAAQRVRGDFTLLWHNSALESQAARDLYCRLL